MMYVLILASIFLGGWKMFWFWFAVWFLWGALCRIQDNHVWTDADYRRFYPEETMIADRARAERLAREEAERNAYQESHP